MVFESTIICFGLFQRCASCDE